MNAPAVPAFDEPRIAQAVEALSDAAIDALPYGVIRLDAEGRVLLLNEAEGRLSGYGRRPAVGRHFFTEVAPCLATDDLLGRIERARASGELDIELEHVGDFDDLNKVVRFRVQSASGGGVWIFAQRL